MNKNSVYQNQSVLYDVDYSLYLQRGRQEQARAMRAAFSGLWRILQKKAGSAGKVFHQPEVLLPRHTQS